MQRLDIIVAQKLGIKRPQAQQLIERGGIELFQFKDKLKCGLKIHPEECEFAVKNDILEQILNASSQQITLSGRDIELEVLYQDEHLAVVNKPAGIATHPNFDDKEPSLVSALINKFGIENLAKNEDAGGELRPGIVHRLDKGTSGLIIIAKTQDALNALKQEFKDRNIKKVYKAICYGVPRLKAGLIKASLLKSDGANPKMLISRDPKAKDAITHYRLEKTLFNDSLCLVECRIETGRTHQIRAHLAHIGVPVVGDDLYLGSKTLTQMQKCLESNPDLLSYIKSLKLLNRQLLHACFLGFYHPFTGDYLHFSSEPDFLQKVMAF